MNAVFVEAEKNIILICFGFMRYFGILVSKHDIVAIYIDQFESFRVFVNEK